jgi:succinyl-diaminopimelate desuccinylase
MYQDKVLSLTSQLVESSAPTGEDRGGQDLLATRLSSLGFTVNSIEAGGRQHLLALHGEGPEYFAFSGHTDVVPAGEGWKSDPFKAEVREDRIYGRGVADMKGAVAAFMIAVEDFLTQNQAAGFPIAILIAGDEETESAGTPALLRELEKGGRCVRWCLVGEPSATSYLGDCIKVGRRGSLTGRIHLKGIQGHVAYPHLAHNPIHDLSELLTRLQSLNLDEGLPFGTETATTSGTQEWPRTSFQVTLISGGLESATNMIPDSAFARFNIRYRIPHSRESLITLIESEVKKYGFDVTFTWGQGTLPYDSAPGIYRDAVVQAVREITGATPQLTRDGGTSDGRFIARAGASVVEVGPSNATIHKVDENLECSELTKLVLLYQRVLEKVSEKWLKGDEV